MVERYRVEVMAEAATDLTRIFDYIEKDSPQNAASVLTSIFDAVDSLDHFPHRCKIHLSRRDPTRIIRSMVVAPFIIYYRIREKEKVVEVLTIRHGARRQPRKFKWRKS
jgi:plasmid stabilization system protein ParE